MSKKKRLTHRQWLTELRRLARKAGLSWLLGNADYGNLWREGLSPREVMQDIYEDADCPLVKD